MSNYNKILLALLGGAAIGAAVGILLAPEKGEETRKKLSDAAKDLSDRIMNSTEEAIKETAEKVSTRIKQKI